MSVPVGRRRYWVSTSNLAWGRMGEVVGTPSRGGGPEAETGRVSRRWSGWRVWEPGSSHCPPPCSFEGHLPLERLARGASEESPLRGLLGMGDALPPSTHPGPHPLSRVCTRCQISLEGGAIQGNYSVCVCVGRVFLKLDELSTTLSTVCGKHPKPKPFPGSAGSALCSRPAARWSPLL